MRFVAVASDYDGTLAEDGKINQQTVEALQAVRDSGRKLILLTGRHLPELLQILPEIELFDRVIAENGALLYRPRTREERPLAEPIPGRLVRELERQGVSPLAVGRAIVATVQPHEHTVLQAIKDLGLDLHVSFNKGAVMILHSGINKGTGLGSALAELGLSVHNVVGFGDAENDYAFLRLCECSVAVANALGTIKQKADLVTQGDHARGVLEIVQPLLANDLRDFTPRLGRHNIVVGMAGEEEVTFSPFDTGLLIAGPSGGGKSTAAMGILERLADCGYQFCLIDPEADFSGIQCALTLGTGDKVPTAEEVMQVLADPGKNVAVNLMALPIGDRPQFLASLLPRIQELRSKTGRPHWIILDEAHHLTPSARQESLQSFPQSLGGTLMITVHPDHIASVMLSRVSIVLAVGESPDRTVCAFLEALGERPCAIPPYQIGRGEALVWSRENPRFSRVVKIQPGSTLIRRHRRKYAQGQLGPDNSFYFRGPQRKLNLRAQNLEIFLQLAQGIDDDTWVYHLQQGDYSSWFRNIIKDEVLASEIERIERADNSPAESREAVKAAVERHYTGAP